MSNVDAADRGVTAERHDVERQLAADWPPAKWRDVTVVVAVSGGGDSLALLRALHAIRRPGAGRLVAAHFNHHLRPSADDDARFVQQTCQQWDIELVVGHNIPSLSDAEPNSDAASLARSPADPTADDPTADDPTADDPTPAPTDEDTARRLRYRFLRTTVDKMGARYLATAHNSDDQAETILHRILRGTGLPGLQGIPRLRRFTSDSAMIRPLLGVSRQQLRQYLQHLGQDCREDPTNLDLRYTRNRIRHELLPELARSYNPQVADALLRLGRLAGDAERALQGTVEGLCEDCVIASGNEVRVLCIPLAVADGYLVRRVFMHVWQQLDWPSQGMTMQHWDELAHLVTQGGDEENQDESRGQAVPRMLPGAVRATLFEDILQLVRM